MNYYRSCYYESLYPLYSFDWSFVKDNSTNDNVHAIVMSSYREDLVNKIQIVHGLDNEDDDSIFLNKVAQCDVSYPATKVSWDPQIMNHGIERFASTSQCLELFLVEYDETRSINGNNITRKAVQDNFVIQPSVKLANSKLDVNKLPPLTSFDWNVVDNNYILTSSIDTTCTLWDLTKQSVKTQLIAHDSEVFDVKFVHNDVNNFFSVGNDGSMRLFDLRALDHSTIIFEPQARDATLSQTMALLRIDSCKTNQYLAATFGNDSNLVLIMDMRYPGSPTFVLNAHEANVNSVAWHPNKQALVTGSDDCQAMYWDLHELNSLSEGKRKDLSPEFQQRVNKNSNSVPWNKNGGGYLKSNLLEYPNKNYVDPLEINHVGWNKFGDWLGVVSGKGFQAVKL